MRDSREKKCDDACVEWAGKFHTFTTTRLNDEDILAADTFLDLHSGLAALELVEKHLGLGYAEVVADSPRARSAAVRAARRRVLLLTL